ncbi:MAG: universal stress protein [Pseudomonadota bacterium]|nr:universal stress protein [Pseudomonadota bacterium]
MQYQDILLASHGTPGAQAAEKLALSLCSEGATLHHLLVVPDLWRGMMGDDWLNNVRTRIAFGEYLEGELSREIAEHLDRLSRASAALGIRYQPEVRQGDPAECLIAFARQVRCELIVIGAPRPKRTPGLRSRLQTEPLMRALTRPLMVAPHPR